jgi:hypothetical protein
MAAPGAKLSPQDQADAARIEAYLNSVKSLKARFSPEMAASPRAPPGLSVLAVCGFNTIRRLRLC